MIVASAADGSPGVAAAAAVDDGDAMIFTWEMFARIKMHEDPNPPQYRLNGIRYTGGYWAHLNKYI